MPVCIDICVCTYHRPAVIDVLRDIAAQTDCDDMALRVVVADNADEPDAREAIVRAGVEFSLDLTYTHAPARNISIARNACLDTSEGDWIAFLDDDESPSPGWLAALMAEARRGGWDAVLGPVQAIYPDAAPHWLRAGNFHSTGPVWVGGQIKTGYTGNVLLRRATIRHAGLDFRLDLGRSGGEDLDFFYRLHDAGGRIGYAEEALVHEPVPLNRIGLRYLLKRSFRRGQTHGTRLRSTARSRVGTAYHLTVAIAKAGVLGAAAIACSPKALPRNRFLTRAALHCGVVARLAGVSEIRLY